MSAWTKEREAEAVARCEAATPGPWIVGSTYGQCHMEHRHGAGKCVYDTEVIGGGDNGIIQDREYKPTAEDRASGQIAGRWGYEDGGIRHPLDTAFIASARTDLPDAIAEIRRLREVIENAPHDEDCAYIVSIASRIRPRVPVAACDCWKSEAVPPSTT